MRFLILYQPSKSVQVSTIGDCFVDDTELGINYEASDKSIPLLPQAQHTDQKHTYYWYASGSKVACDKSSWYYIKSLFINGVPHMLKKDSLPGILQSKPSFSSNPVEIQRLDIHEARKTLG